MPPGWVSESGNSCFINELRCFKLSKTGGHCFDKGPFRGESLLSELLQQGLDLGVLELNDLLLTLVHKAAKGSQHDVPWLEQKSHVRRRNWQCPVPTDESKRSI